MKDPKFQFNDRVEFKDSENIFHIGFVKRIKCQKRSLFKRGWVYDICAYVKGESLRRVYVVPEADIFGIMKNEDNKKPTETKGQKTFKSFKELSMLKL